MRIKTKLIALFAVPLLALAAVAAVGFRGQSVAFNEAEQTQRAAITNEANHRFNQALANERLSRLNPLTSDGARVELASATDEALAELLRLTGAVEETGTDAQLALADARNSTDPWVAVSAYNGVFDVVSGAVPTGIESINDADLLNSLLVSITVGESLETRDRAWLNYLAKADADDPDTISITGAFVAASRSRTDGLRLAAPDTAARLNAAYATDALQNLNVSEALALNGILNGEFTIDLSQGLLQLGSAREVLSDAHSVQNGELVAAATDRLEQAEAQRQLFFLLALIGGIVLIGMLYTINRSISRPLVELVDRADHVANAQLPALIARLRSSRGLVDLPDPPQIKASSGDEIGDLVRAFNEMQTTAHSLATEQAISRRNVADMFVNLGRRNQQLLQRMVQMVTDLERTEENPETLEALFALDHMVTRMRRNAESLLVLAGSQAPRQWARPVDIEKATRGALSEVEKYQRVVINQMDSAHVQGAIVVDVTHLLAELLENALTFSDPSTAVTIDGQRVGDGYLLSITDHGIGMSEQELFENNQRLNNPPQLDLAPTRFLGLFVVGRLAERHDIRVDLVPGARQGIVARIQIPDSILADSAEQNPSGDTIVDLTPAQPAGATAPEAPPLAATPLRATASEAEPDPTDVGQPVAAPQAVEPVIPPQLRAEAAPIPPAFEPVRPDPRPSIPSVVEQSPGSPLPTRGGAPTPDLPLRSQPPTPAPQPGNQPVIPQPVAQPAPTPNHQNPVPTAAPMAEGAGPERRRPLPGVEHPTPPPATQQHAGSPGGLPTRTPGASAPQPARPTPQGHGEADPQVAATGFSSMLSAFSSGVNRGLQDSDSEPEGPNQ